jgi:AcrR family transcriptional regulator
VEDKRRDIFNSGKELFSVKGFKETNISDITKQAGVAVGTFYNYFASKDKLFMDIYLEENAKLKHRMMEAVNPDDPPLKLIKQLMALNLEGMQANPILKEWYNREVFMKLEQQFREENGVHAVDFLFGGVVDLVKQWQADGKMRSDIDVDMIMAMFLALINIDTHKEEIGFAYFPQVLEYLTEFVIDGLSVRPE